MKHTLFINACVRENSRTLLLAKHLLGKLDGKVRECTLNAEDVQPLRADTLAARDACIAAGDYSADMFRFARDFAAADRIVIAAPYWDLCFPALLKDYLENVTVGGLTFYYDETGVPRSLCRAKQLIYITTAGGPIFANFGFDYVRTMASGFFGIDDCVFFGAENLDIVGADVPALLQEATQQIDAYFGE